MERKIKRKLGDSLRNLERKKKALATIERQEKRVKEKSIVEKKKMERETSFRHDESRYYWWLRN